MRTKNEFPKLIDVTANEELFRRKLLEKSFLLNALPLKKKGLTFVYRILIKFVGFLYF